MKRHPVGPAVMQAFDYVAGRLRRGMWLEGECLPSARDLAAGARVSIATMIRAVARLKAKGLITCIERGRIRAGSATIEIPRATKHADAAWHLQRAALEQDILNGVFAQRNQLPTIKELQARYGAGYRTIRRILFGMVSDGALQLRGRTYEINSSRPRSARQRILFLVHSLASKPLTALNRGQYRIFDLLEYECIRRGIQLKIMDIDRFIAAGQSRLLAEASDKMPQTGYVIDLWWGGIEQFKPLLTKLLAKVSGTNKPIAILDENGDFDLPIQFAASPLFQVFRIEGRKAGARIARFLLGLGHRSVAFVSSFHHTVWSRERFAGVAEQYGRAGCGERLTKVVRENIELVREHMFAFSDFDERLIRRLLSSDSMSTEDERYHHYLEFKKRFSARQFLAEDIEAIRYRLTIVKELAERTLSDDDLNQLVDTLFWQIGGAINPTIQAPMFRQALSIRGVTAWICANDDIALSALQFLRKKGVKVPGDISVVGFDNQPVRALERRLTSLDFNAPAFVHRMLDHIARPPRPRGPYRHQPIEVESVVMARDTTAGPWRGPMVL